MEIESKPNIEHNCKYHVVFCSKYRRKVLVNPVDQRLYELVSHKGEELGVGIELKVRPDHVDMIVTCDPRIGVHRVVKQIKAYTSHHLRREFKSLTTRLPTLWSNSYFVSTVGEVSHEAVQRYMETQKE
ncbi:IS200/IS605 family transposase [Paenibacillus elgii]|uniref:IS200/IS605 family transposase n=1 Tax=Paenibacillus elgii TaxID=189691 RepID=UPI0013D8ABBC|nr:IS200/IS605 family transposase [Paenibacillus elgii]